MNKKQTLGGQGEMKALEYLDRNGYEVIAKNFKCRFGEIDIIAKRDNVFIFIEVKTRSGLSMGRPAESVTYKKQIRIRNAATSFLTRQADSTGAIPAGRCDVIELIKDKEGRFYINHIENAF